MASWIMVEGDSFVEEKRVTNVDTGTIKVYRRKVLTTLYESHEYAPSFAWTTSVAETTLFGTEDSTRCVRHGFRNSPITGKVVQTKEVIEPGNWKHVDTYAIEEAEDDTPPPPE